MGEKEKQGSKRGDVNILRMILRPGGVTLEQLRKVIPTMQVYEQDKDTEDLVQRPPTPGLKYRHYSPKAGVLLLIGNDLQNMKAQIKKKIVSELYSFYFSFHYLFFRKSSLLPPKK